MNFKAICPRCARAFAFDLDEIPVQRAGPKGTAKWRRIVAYYPTCPHCHELVEVLNALTRIDITAQTDRPT